MTRIGKDNVEGKDDVKSCEGYEINEMRIPFALGGGGGYDNVLVDDDNPFASFVFRWGKASGRGDGRLRIRSRTQSRCRPGDGAHIHVLLFYRGIYIPVELMG